MNKNRRAVKTAAASWRYSWQGAPALEIWDMCTQQGKIQKKEETVYVKADTDGSTDKVIVSNWLKNPDGKSQLIDHADLTEIENVKGDKASQKWKSAHLGSWREGYLLPGRK